MAVLMAPRRIGNNSGPPELARMVKLGFCQASTPYGEPSAHARTVNGGRGWPGHVLCGTAVRTTEMAVAQHRGLTVLS